MSSNPRYQSQIRYDKQRSRTRVNIGDAFERWCQLKRTKGLKSHAEVAAFLLDRQDSDEPCTSTPLKKQRKNLIPEPALSSIVGTPSPSRGQLDTSKDDENTVTATEEEGGPEERPQDMSEEEEHHVEMNVEEINDLRNSVIDWKHSEPEVHSDSSADEDYVPDLCIRTGGALKKCPCIANLRVINADETVHDDPELAEPAPFEADTTPPNLPPPLQVKSEQDVRGTRAFILYEESIKQLASFLVLPVGRCPFVCKVSGMQCDSHPPYNVSILTRGSACILDWTCAAGHRIWRWNSQPSINYGMQYGDFMMACNILLSGNNYTKVALLFRFMNLGIVAPNTFYSIQDVYCVDTIKECWMEHRREVIDRIKQRDVVLIGDGRMDSPGHCAQYCTYTIMDNLSKEIVSIQTVDKRQTGRNSVIMEKKAFVDTMTQLVTEVKVVEVCTDAHVQISSLMARGLFPGVRHSFDMWHGSKNLAKRISAVAKTKRHPELLVWLRDIINHFWWVCCKADTYDQFMDLWLSLLHHVVNEHHWVLGQCQHAALETSSTKQWLEKGSKAFDALQEIMMDKRWLKTVDKYLTFRSTADLEAFQSHILMYVSKRFSFTPPVYEARTILAALDYNHHRGRPDKKTADGKQIYRRLYKKNARRWSVYAVKESKKYEHIPALQAKIIWKRLADGGLPLQRPLRPEDPRRLGLVPALPPPPMEDLLQTQTRRGHGPIL